MNFDFRDSIIAGGLLNINDKNIILRSYQIKEGIKIHTCNDYDNSLEVIKEASFGIENKVSLISKIYYKYPDINHRRYRPMLDQLNEHIIRLGFIPSKWYIQLCCYCPPKELLSKNAENFFYKIKEKFGIQKIFLENYPVYKYTIGDILILNNYYQNDFKFGFIGYQNLQNRVFQDHDLIQYSRYSVEVIFMGILGKGSQNKFINYHNQNNNNFDLINKNINYFLSNKKNNNKIMGISSFSSIEQFIDFKERFNKLNNTKSNIYFQKDCENNLEKKIYYFEGYDQYGGYISLVNYCMKPKLILFKVKYLILSFFKSRKFSNNFFG